MPDSALDNLFQAYGDRATGTTWTGGDGTESVLLPDGRELWLFADSYLGTLTNGERIRARSQILHNTLVIQRNGVLTKTRYKHRRKNLMAFLNPVPTDPSRYGIWPGSMVLSGTTLQVIGLNVKFERNGMYSVTGNSLATFALPSLRLQRLQSLPPSNTDWSEGVLRDGGYTYVYGNAAPNTYAARVEGDNLSAPWSYYDGSGWTSDAAAAEPISSVGTLSHFSVSKVGSLYVLITKSFLTTNVITAAFGCNPVGPFGPPQPIYATPEASEFPSVDGVVTYGAFAHPELSKSPNTLVVSYDVNVSSTNNDPALDASLYRPRFLDVTIR